MRLGTSLLLIIASFATGRFMRAPAIVSEKITFVSQPAKPAPKSEVVAGRAPASAMVVQEAGFAKPIRETINGVDVVQAMLVKDMAKVYAANRAYESAWRHQFIDSHVHTPSGPEMDKLEASLLRGLPVQKSGEEKVYRGRTTLTLDGKSVYIDVVMSMNLQNWEQTDVDARKSTISRPCFRLDGFIAVDKIVERLSFDQTELCSQKIYERMDTAFIGVDNYRRKSGSIVNMLLFPVNPRDNLPLEYLTANSADWQKDNEWTWEEAGPEALSDVQSLMVNKAMAAGIDPTPLFTIE